MVDPRGDLRADEGKMAMGRGVPGLSRKLVQWVVLPGERDVVDAELLEDFVRRVARDGEPAARRWYRRQVVGFVLRSVRVRSLGRTREGTGMNVFASMLEDSRLALRGLRRRPTFTVVAVGTLALGIGANSAIFTLVSAHFLAPLP